MSLNIFKTSLGYVKQEKSNEMRFTCIIYTEIVRISHAKGIEELGISKINLIIAI
jgi:hypothetical protein